MNILPKKRWHVRTKENIARVRKDEAEAAAKEQEEQKRIENADREARLNLLKLKGKQRRLESSEVPAPAEKQTVTTIENSIIDTDGHVNLFSNHEYATDKTNTEHEKEIKEKNEEYEKKIGYLTYLGQDTNEALGKKNWYEVLPESSRFSRSSEIKVSYDKLVLKDADGKEKLRKLDEKDGEVDFKAKSRQDPLNIFAKYHKKPEIIKKTIQKEKSKITSSDNKIDKLKKLREARLKREREERQKTDKFLLGLNGESSKPVETPPTPKIKPKYNSQFNPDLARQNYY